MPKSRIRSGCDIDIARRRLDQRRIYIKPLIYPDPPSTVLALDWLETGFRILYVYQEPSRVHLSKRHVPPVISADRRQHALSSTPCIKKWNMNLNLAGNSTRVDLRHWRRIYSWFGQWAFHIRGGMEVYILISACRRQNFLSSTPCTRKRIVNSNLAGNSTRYDLRHWDRIHLGSVNEFFERGWMEVYKYRPIDNVGISKLAIGGVT